MTKYANYIFNGKTMNNIGDNMQIIAIDYFYSLLGIQKSEIVYIDKNSLAKYSGENVILPVTMPLVDYVEHGLAGRFSDNIIPLFLGLTMVTDELMPEEVDYLKRFEPIGCRDERTYNTIIKYGINAYLGGCITAALPESRLNNDHSKIYLVDIPDSLNQFIPKTFEPKIVRTTHMWENLKDPKEKMIEQYNMYQEHAELVVTSLLHCSIPCIAAGIPTIIAKSEVSYRFEWVEKLAHIYTPDEFNAIDWEPKPIIYQDFKKKLKNMILNRLKGINDEKELAEISNAYLDRQRKEYVIDAFETLKTYIYKNWNDHNKTYYYSVWGVTQTAEYLHSYIMQNYPKAILVSAYDRFNKMNFHGINTVIPNERCPQNDEYLFVTTYSANEDAKKTFYNSDKKGMIAYMKIIR